MFYRLNGIPPFPAGSLGYVGLAIFEVHVPDAIGVPLYAFKRVSAAEAVVAGVKAQAQHGRVGLEQAGIRAAFLNAIDAARVRSAELALGEDAQET